MTFETSASKMGREPFVVAELVLDYCANTIRNAPCTANPATGFECYNTFSTCQDPTNYVKTEKIYRFSEARVKMPVANLDAIPCIVSASFTAPRLMPSKAFSARGAVTLRLKDFTHNDRLVDKYAATRLVDPLLQGTFAGKFKARNPFAVGRILRTYEGFLDDDGTFSLDNARRRDYIIESIDGPDSSDHWTIKGKDILKRTDGDRAQCPRASDGALQSALTAVATTIQLAAGYTAAYSDAHIRIGDEIIDVSGATFDPGTRTWTGVTRGAGGTTASEHQAGDAVQECKTWAATNVIDVVRDLLEDFSGIESSYIPYTDWQAEKTQSLNDFNLSTIISEPTGVDVLLDELCEQVLLDIHFDEVAREVVLRHETQWIADSAELNDSEHLLADSVDVRDRHDLRLSRVWVFYGMKNYAEKLDADNFDRASVRVSASDESANRYGDQRVKKIYSRWFDSSAATPANLLTQRLIDRYGGDPPPREISYSLDARHEGMAKLGEVVKISTRKDQDEAGAARGDRFQLIETDPAVPGHRYQFKALRYNGVPKTNDVHISGDTSDYNLFDELGQPPDPVTVTLYVDPGVTVTGAPAITTGNLAAGSFVTLINQGHIYGNAGVPGAGGDAQADPSDPYFLGSGFADADEGGNGLPGGDAINITVDAVIDNTAGEIFGGGGGGGGNGGSASSITGNSEGGGGGGAGQGGNTQAGGIGGNATSSGGGVATDGTDGGSGDETGPGAAGSPGAGAGGPWGQDGEDADQTERFTTTKYIIIKARGGRGGPAGYAVRKNGNELTWIGGNNATQVKGSVA